MNSVNWDSVNPEEALVDSIATELEQRIFRGLLKTWLIERGKRFLPM
jgi:hypothetical protein